MDMNTILWLVQILLAVAFLVAGYGHAFAYPMMSANPRMGWMTAVGPERMRLIGILEMLGAIGLILPAALKILPWLTPVAALGLAILMGGAIVLHVQRKESPNIVLNLVLGLLALFVAYGRFVLEPIS